MSGNTARGQVLAAAIISCAALTVSSASAQQPPGAWSTAAALPQGRDEVQAAAVGDKIYLIGGSWSETKDGKRIEHYTDGFTSEFDPNANQWRERRRAPEGLTHQGIA